MRRGLPGRLGAVLALAVLIGGTATPALAASSSPATVLSPSADAAARIGAALAAGRPVRLTAGLYPTTDPIALPAGATLALDPGAVVRGDLPGRSVIRMASGSRLTGGRIVNTATADCLGVEVLRGARGVRIRGTTFGGARMNAVVLDEPGIRDVAVTGSRFDGVVYGVLLNPGATGAASIAVTGNTFSGISGDAVEINGAMRRAADRPRDVQVLRNRITRMTGRSASSGFGVGLAGVDGFRIAWNRFEGVRNEAVHLEDRTAHGVVAANVVRGGGSAGRPAIAVQRTVDDVDVRRNVVDRFDGAGIAVLWDALGSATRIRVTRNVVERVTGDAVVVAGDRGTGPFLVDGNLLRGAGGSGVAVLGSHARSVVSGNAITGARGGAVTVRLAGGGTRVIDRTAAAPSAAAVLGGNVAAFAAP